jgi:hypothetical protein
MEFHFIGITPTKSVLSMIDGSGKSRYMIFRSGESANNAVEYISRFRARYGQWPVFDMTNPRVRIESKVAIKRRDPEYVKKFMQVYEQSREDIDLMALETGASFFWVNNFLWSPQDKDALTAINFSGSDIDGFSDADMYKQKLEYNLKIK